MEMKFAQCVNKGMQRDYSMNTASQEFAYENKNIRITTTGNESFLTVGNEKSTVYNPVLLAHLQTYDVRIDYKYHTDNIHIETLTITFNFYDGTAEKEEPLKKNTTFRIYDNYEGSIEYEEIVIPKGVTTFTITDWDIQNLHFDRGVEIVQIDNKELYNMNEDVPVNIGTVLGVATIGEYVIVFSKYEDSSEDVIYRLKEFDYEVWLAETVFRGDLNFDINHPIECTTSYESEDVQKVYWVDGLNQPRVVNICKLGQTEHTTNLDFSPKIGGNIKVEIEKEQNGAGLFPAGEVQYFITYYNKFGQESQAAYVSPIYHISPSDKGGEADKTQTCSFRILISDVDKKYDHVRVYSAIRTTKNGEYIVSIVGDLSMYEHGNVYQIIDTNTNVINVPSSDILFLGGSVIFPSTIEQKDNTLFLGNIKTGVNTINEELDKLKEIFSEIRDDKGVIDNTDLLQFVYKVVPSNFEDPTSLYPYNPELKSNEYDTHFKLREKYRVGIQFIHETGEQSQTVFIGDIINKEHYPHYASQDVMNDFEFSNTSRPNIVNNYYVDDSGNIHLYDVTKSDLKFTDYLCLPILSFNSSYSGITEVFDSIKAKGFNNYRLMIAETDYKDKSIICQGYINPLTFRSGRRANNECYGQESWTIRPIGTYKHLENINKCDESGYTEFSEIRGSTKDDSYKKDAVLKVTPNSSSLRKISLICSSTNDLLGGGGRPSSLSYRIIVSGTNKDDEPVNLTFSRSFGPRASIYKVYKKEDVDNKFITFDTWTNIKIFSLCTALNVTVETLASIGIKAGDRIFGYMPQYPWDGLEDTHHVDYIYHQDVRNIDVNLGSAALDSGAAYKDNFFLDASQFSLNTPDLNNIQDIISNNPNLKCRIVGKIDIDRVTTDYNVTLADSIKGDSMSSVYKFNFSKVLNSDETAIGIKNFPVVYNVGDGKAYNLMLFDKDGQIPENTESSPVTNLKNKLVGNLWYASKTDYEFHWRYSDESNESTKYFPKTQSYKETTRYQNIFDDYTFNAEEQSWYTGLIECDLDLYYETTSLWGESKYINGMFMLKDIDDLSYIKNWRWRRSEGKVTSYTNISTILDSITNSAERDSQVQVRMKYKPTNNILLNLKPSFSDVYCLPGYANYDLQDCLQYLWVKSPVTTNDVEVESLPFTLQQLEYDYVTINGKTHYSNVFKINFPKDSYDFVVTGTEYLLNTSLVSTYPMCYYDKCIALCTKIDTEGDFKTCTFQISTTDASFSANLGDETSVPLYKIKSYYHDSHLGNISSSKNIFLLDYASNTKVTTPYLTSLKSFLGGDNFLYDRYYSSEVERISQKYLFYPSNYFNRYLPFNLKGTFFDTPYIGENYTIEGNGINNSLWVCELYKDFDSFDFLGGISENAIELNTFIPASKTCPIGTTAYGVYGDTYFKRWDHLRIYPSTDDDQTNGIVDAVSLMVETYINLDGDTREARKRLDIRNMRPSNMEGLVNDVYSQKNNIITSHVLDDKFNVTLHPLQYWWSLTKTPNSDIDTWTGVNLTSVAELDGDKGPLNKIKRWNNQLFAFQDKAIAMINFNNQTTIATQEGVPVEIQNSGKVNGHYYITTNNGCKNKWSIVESPVGLYFIDSYNKSISVIGEGIKSLSQLNLFQDWIEQKEQGNVWNPLRFQNAFKGFYDPIHKEVYFANGEDCICYNELLEQFTSFYDYEKMNYMFLMDNHIYSIPSSNKLYLMFEGKDYCNLYDKQRDYYIQYKVNNEPFIDKTWTNLEYRADIFNRGNIQTNEFDTNAVLANETFDSLKVWNEYQNGELDLNKISFGYLRGAKPKFRIWRTNLPRAKSTDTNRFGLDRMRNPWIMLELRKSGDTSKRMEFHDLIVKYVI